MIPSDDEIAEGLRQGSPDAFRALYQAHGRSILAYLTRMTGRKEMAEELVQETFLTAVRKIGFFRAGPDGSLKAWVFRIATHLTLDSLRREKRMESSPDIDRLRETEAALDPSASDENPQAALERFEFSRLLMEAIQELTPSQRTIFLLREQEELSLLEISRVCGCSENSIKQSLFRSRTALRKILSEKME